MARDANFKRLAVAAAAFLLFNLLGLAAYGADSPPSFGGAQATTAAAGTEVHGWLLTKSDPAAGEISSAHQGCSTCSWQVFRECSDSSPGVASPSGDRCTGPDVSCGPGQQRMFVFFSPDTSAPLTQLDSYCFTDSDNEITTAESIAPDVRRYAGEVAVGKPVIRAWPRGGTTLVNLATFFAVAATPSATQSFGGQGYTMQIQVSPSDYSWSFGDGSTLSTKDPGSAPPGGAVNHTYSAAGSVNVTVTVNYGATYSVVTPAGTIGPLPVDGGPVRSLPAATGLQVKEAIAGLTQ